MEKRRMREKTRNFALDKLRLSNLEQVLLRSACIVFA